jgi:3,4-dihydroxy 2-butanone 4-phosphate synthase/GTP cyclohydrolase II
MDLFKMNKNEVVTSRVEKVVKDVADGKMIIIIDDPKRENEGDLFCAASKITPEKINFMTKFGRGLICVPMKSQRLKDLDIKAMVEQNSESQKCDFAVSVDYKYDVTTGISAYDRALTIKKLTDSKAKPSDFLRPGHIFPLKSKEGGVLDREGHTEAAVDLAKLAGLYPAGVICEIMNENGRMSKIADLVKFAKKYNLKIVSIKELIEYRKQKEVLVKEVVRVNLPTEYGDFKLIAFEGIFNKKAHLALIKGNIKDKKNVLTRVHSSCLTGDVFHSGRCDCGSQLEHAMKEISKNGSGIVLYLLQEGRGIGIVNKLKAYRLQEKGLDTVEANIALGFAPDLRDYAAAASILKLLGVKSIVLMTNNPDKIEGITKYNIKVSDRVPVEIEPVKTNKKYLSTKKYKMGHLLDRV